MKEKKKNRSQFSRETWKQMQKTMYENIMSNVAKGKANFVYGKEDYFVKANGYGFPTDGTISENTMPDGTMLYTYDKTPRDIKYNDDKIKDIYKEAGRNIAQAFPDAGELNVQGSFKIPGVNISPINEVTFGISLVHTDDGFDFLYNFGFDFSSDPTPFSISGNVNAMYSIEETYYKYTKIGSELTLNDLKGIEFTATASSPTPWKFNLGANYIWSEKYRGGGLNFSTLSEPSFSVSGTNSQERISDLIKF